MYLGEKFRKHGLAEVVRDVWANEQLSPPRECRTDAAVWAWIDRSDVAFGLAAGLVWDIRLVVLGAAACVGPAASFISRPAVELVRASERIVYGIDGDEWVDLVAKFTAEQALERRRKGARVVPLMGHPIHSSRIENPDWQDWGFAGVTALASAIGVMRRNASIAVVREELRDAVKHSHRALFEKFRNVDGWPESAAHRCASELQLHQLKRVIGPESFAAPYTYKRSDPQ